MGSTHYFGQQPISNIISSGAGFVTLSCDNKKANLSYELNDIPATFEFQALSVCNNLSVTTGASGQCIVSITGTVYGTSFVADGINMSQITAIGTIPNVTSYDITFATSIQNIYINQNYNLTTITNIPVSPNYAFIDFSDNALSTASVDTILSILASMIPFGGPPYPTVSLHNIAAGTNQPPTNGALNADYLALLADGWTVNIAT